MRFSDGSGDFGDGASVPVLAGVDHALTCNAEGSKPAAILTWIVDGTSTNTPQTDTENDIQGLWDTSSSYTLSPQENDHMEQVRCTASVPGEAIAEESRITLDVKGSYFR